MVIGERGLKEGIVEYQPRREKEPRKVPVGDALGMLKEKAK